MCNIPLQKWVRPALERVLRAENLKEALQGAAESYIQCFPKRKFWIAEKLGKRVSYLTGAGRELYLQPEKIDCGRKYTAFIQSRTGLTAEEKKVICSIITLAITLHKKERNDYSE